MAANTRVVSPKAPNKNAASRRAVNKSAANKSTVKKGPAKKRAGTRQTTADKKRAAEIIHLLLEHTDLRQVDIADALFVTPAVISLLKHQKWPSDVSRYTRELEQLVKAHKLAPLLNKTAPRRKARSKEDFADWLLAALEKYELTPVDLAARAGVSAQAIGMILDGTTINPQRATREKIQSALPATPDQPPGEENKGREIFSGLPYIKEEIDQVPARAVGVYAIHDRLGRVTYVGQGMIRQRLRTHADNRAFIDPRIAHSFSYVVIGENTPENRKESMWLESLIIRFGGNTMLLNKRLVQDLSEAAAGRRKRGE